MRNCGCTAETLSLNPWALALDHSFPKQPCPIPILPTHTQKLTLSSRSIISSSHDLLELNDVQWAQCCFICFLAGSRCHELLQHL